jgi:hypothetical protein
MGIGPDWRQSHERYVARSSEIRRKISPGGKDFRPSADVTADSLELMDNSARRYATFT